MKASEFYRLRTECGWTQSFVGELVGRAQSYVSAWENAQRDIPDEVASALRTAAEIMKAARAALEAARPAASATKWSNQWGSSDRRLDETA